MPPGKKLKEEMGASGPAAGSNGQGIDVLPDGVLAHIIGFLPAEEAVRTCVLSRRWRDLWKSATGLRVVAADGQFLGTVEKLVEFVDRLLTLRGGTSLDTCVLEVGRYTVPGGNWHIGNDVLRRLNVWFRHAVECRVQFVRIHTLCDRRVCPYPCHEFEDLPLVSQYLTKLELHGAYFGSRSLDFSSCLALEHLVFAWCDISAPAEMISFEYPKSLKYLTMTGCVFEQGHRIHINAPSLVSLCLENFLGPTPVLGSMPSLEEAIVQISSSCYDHCQKWWEEYDGGYCGCEFCDSSHNISGDSNNSVLLKGLSEARKLTLISEPEMFIFRTDVRCCPTFSKMKNLLLNDYWCVPDDFHALASILEHSPVLEQLTFQFFSQGVKHKLELEGSISSTQRSATISMYLKAVKVKCVSVDESVINVLKFLHVVDIALRYE